MKRSIFHSLKRIYLGSLILCTSVAGVMAQEAPANIRLKEATLMHEMRATPSPINKAVVADRAVSFQWPLHEDAQVLESGLDGSQAAPKKKVDKSKLRYKLRYSQDPTFKKNTVTVETRWPFFNPEKDLTPGVWHWQYGYVINGKVEWNNIQQFTVKANPNKFCPPSLKEVLAKLPASHPRVWLDKKEWQSFISRNAASPDRKTYIGRADKALKTPMKSVNDINTKLAEGLDSEMKRNAMLTRESRRIIDGAEAGTDVLIRAYLLTKDKKYADEAIKRVKEIISWASHKNIKGDFNDATFVSISSLAYDALYDLLDADTKKALLACIQKYGNKMYRHYSNHLENHIADNHVWQMTLRILTMAAFTVYGELPDAELWADYCYNIWLARFPGLNKDGGWHNGDSYFHVNIRTLVEVPYFYSRITGFNYFSDPWYQGNAMYVIYQQPPFSKSGGNGSSHLGVSKPSGPRVSYADAIARMTGNTYAADYVRRIQAKQRTILTQASTSKGGGLAWFRLLCDKPLPEGPGLADMPLGYVFPETGLASFSTRLDNTGRSAMISFRSSPYGSTSHALANQNAFNTFWSGQPIFYSAGHHISFTDKHSMTCHRGTWGHNTILVNGLGQRIGTEGYGWMPRWYVGEKLGYVLCDASNAYGEVVSPLWVTRGKESDVDYTPENGWGKSPLTKFRRHFVELGRTGYTFVYDELEASEPADWSYLLHTVTNPMTVEKTDGYIHIQGTSKNGISDAYLFASGELKTDTTHEFRVPAINWLRADANGKFKPYDKHWHFTATSVQKSRAYRFATIIYTHAKPKPDAKPIPAPQILKDGRIKVGRWMIKVNTGTEGKPMFFIHHTGKDEKVSITYRGDETVVVEDGSEATLKDKVPELEI